MNVAVILAGGTGTRLGEDIPKSIFCMRHFLSMRWLKPVTEEGREGLRLYREEQK